MARSALVVAVAGIGLLGLSTRAAAQVQSGDMPRRTLEIERRLQTPGSAVAAADEIMVHGGRVVLLRAAETQVNILGDGGEVVHSLAIPRRRAQVDTARPLVVTMGRVADRIWTFDEQSLRLTLLSGAGEIIRTMRLPYPRALADVHFGLATIEAVYADSSVLFSASQFIQSGTTTAQTGNSLLRVAANGRVLHRYFALPTGSGRLNPTMARAHPLWGVSADGGYIAAAEVDSVGPTRDLLRLTVLRASGDTAVSTTVRVPDANEAPVGSRLLVGTDGAVWVPLRASADSAHWLVVDPRGTPTMRVTVPGSVRLHSLDDGVWGVANGAVVKLRVAQR